MIDRWPRRIASFALAAAASLAAVPAFAASSATINVDVTIIASLSVSVNLAQTSTMSVTWSAATPAQAFANSGASVTVTNDSGGLTERWALSTDANSIDTTGGGQTWALGVSSSAPGTDKFAVQAVFGSSNTAAGGCPAASSFDWSVSTSATLLTTTPTTYTSTTFADLALTAGGGKATPDSSSPNPGEIYAGDKRALCWQIVTPNSTSTTHQQNIQIVITAQSP